MIVMIMRRILIIALLLANLSLLYASPKVGLSAAYRYDSVSLNSYELNAYVEDENYKVGVLSSFDKAIMAEGRYTPLFSDTLRLDLSSSYYHSFETDGGLATLSLNFGQDLNFSGFALNYRIGIIGALGYSTHSDELHYALSPNLMLETGIKIDDFSLLLYLAGERFLEKSFQSVPIMGIKTEIGFYNQRLVFDSHIKLSDYMEGPTILISDVVFSIGYEVSL